MLTNTNTARSQNSFKESVQISSQIHIQISSHRKYIHIFIDTQDFSLWIASTWKRNDFTYFDIAFCYISIVRLCVFWCIIPPNNYMNSNIKHEPPFLIRLISECKTCRGRYSVQQPPETKIQYHTKQLSRYYTCNYKLHFEHVLYKIYAHYYEYRQLKLLKLNYLSYFEIISRERCRRGLHRCSLRFL